MANGGEQVEGASPPREVPRRRPQTGRETNPRSPSHDPVSAKLLAVRGHQFAMVKPTYQQNRSTNAVTLVFNIDEGPRPRGRGIVLETPIGDAGPGTQVTGYPTNRELGHSTASLWEPD
jgi:hypothetical protein